MCFEIQICNPSIGRRTSDQKETLSSAILAVFPEVTEDAVMVWNWVPIRINYNCDLSVMIEDLLLMLSDVLQSDHGSSATFFGSNTFRAAWSLSWADGTLRIETKWESVAGSYEDLLNSRSTLEVQRGQFLSEWKALLGKVIEAIDTSGIRIADQEHVLLLRRIEAAIPRCGKLYDGTDL